MNKIKEILLKFKYELSVFAALSMNFLLFFTKEELMSDILYPLHLVDVRIGLISRTLVGSISGLLWEHPTKENIFFMQAAVTALTFILTSLFLGKCIKNAEEKSGRALFIISLIISVFPYGFMTFINLFELLDIYWVMTVALILLVSDSEAAVILIPILIFTGSWVHYSFFLAFMPVIYIMCFGKCIKEKSRLSYILTAVTVTVSVPVVLYFVLTQRIPDTEKFDSFIKYIIEKAGSEITNIERYVGMGFRSTEKMKELYDLQEINSDIPELFKLLIGNFRFTLRDTSITAIICDFILVSPVVVFFESVWKTAIKAAEDKKEKFLYFLTAITPVIQLIACFTSSDTSRWLSLMVISQLFILALFVRNKDRYVSEGLRKLTGIFEKHKTPLIFILLFYLSIVFVW